MTDATAPTPPEATRLHVPLGAEIFAWFFRCISIGMSIGGGHLIGQGMGIPWPMAIFTGVIVFFTFWSLDRLQSRWGTLSAVSLTFLALYYVGGQSWNLFTDYSGAKLGVAKFVDEGEAEVTRDQADRDAAVAAQEKFDRAVAVEERAEQALASVQTDIAGVLDLRDRPVAERDRAYALDVRQLQGRIGVRPDGRIGEDTGRAIEDLIRELRAQETTALRAYLEAQAGRETAKKELDDANAKVRAGAGSELKTLAAGGLSDTARFVIPIVVAVFVELLAGGIKAAAAERVPVTARTGVLSKLRRPRHEPPDTSAARPPTRPDLMPLARSNAEDGWHRPMGEIDRATTEAAEAAAAADRRGTENAGAPTVAASSALVARTLRRKGAPDHRYDAKDLRDPNAALRLRGRGDQGGET